MKKVLLLIIIAYSAYSFTTIPLKKVWKQQQQQQQRFEQQLDKNMLYLLKQFLPPIKNELPEQFNKKYPEQKLYNRGEYQYIGYITVGTPPQRFSVQFDTQSAQFWLPSKNCKDLGCLSYNKYYAQKSLTNKRVTSPQLNVFTTTDLGFYIQGIYTQDNVVLGGKSIANVQFGSVDSMTPYKQQQQYQRRDYDGVIGLAFSNLALATPIFQLGFEQKQFQDNSFALYLSQNSSKDSVLVLGGVDPQYASGQFRYYPVQKYDVGASEPIYMTWSVKVNSLRIGNQKVQFRDSIISSSTLFYQTNYETYRKILKLFDVSSNNNNQIECERADQLPSIQLEIGGDSYEIENEYYIYRTNNTGKQTQLCYVAFEPTYGFPQYHAKQTIVLGGLFLQKYYTHFDYGINGTYGSLARVGFALAKQD